METKRVEITQKLLVSAGGWPAMKLAQQLQQAARVSDVAYDPPLLSGLVREGNRNLRSGLRINSPADVENICTCRESREWGKICPHALAVGVQYLAPAPSTPIVPAPAAPTSSAQRPTFIEAGAAVATPIALHFILPPNFESAWAKEQIMVVAEVEIAGQRRPPTTLSPNETYACGTHDLVALDALGELSVMRMFSRLEFMRLLRHLQGHPRVTLGKSTPVQITPRTSKPSLRLSRNDDELTLRISSAKEQRLLAAGDEIWSLQANQLQPVVEGLTPALLELAKGEVTLRGERALRFLAFEAPQLSECFKVEREGDSALPNVEIAAPQFRLSVEGSMRELRAKLRVRYGDSGWERPLPKDRRIVGTTGSAILLPDTAAEEVAVRKLSEIGFTERGERFVLADENRVARFFAFEYPRLRNEWEVDLSAPAAKSAGELQPIIPKLEVVGSGEDWFELRYSLGTPDGENFSAAELQRLLRSGHTRTRLPSGRTAVFDAEASADFEEVLRDAEPMQVQPGTYRIKRAQAGYVAASVEGIGSALQRLTAPTTPPPDVGPLAQQLREYQTEGVAWLWRLAQTNLGGILADEMGLGKTVQTLAFLLGNRGSGPALIVCPTSLVGNWRNEAKRFTPELRALVLDGAERHARFPEIAQHDLVLTSYALVQRDADHYRRMQFSTVVLDEAQHIKNPETQNAQSAFALRGRHRFALTGTPIENSVRDLWSIMNFVLPGYLGSRADFRERYELPLSKGPAPEIQRRLSRRLRPFLLRRKKSDVAKELPEKLEQQVICDLTPKQRAAYDGLLREVQSGIAAEQSDSGAARMKMLLGLLRLRQVCCDLRLLGREAEANESAKLALLDELLDEAIDGGHRVLVFSQFVSMLTLIRERLAAKAVRFSYLDGATKDRQSVVDQFHSDDAIAVFLMSLKAGGVGLNLSAADTVIHFDPWWNYAAEAQATDRAHRIGQTRVVTAYKLIARDTVEEKIVKLQARKRSASEATIGSEEPLMSGLTSAEIEELLS